MSGTTVQVEQGQWSYLDIYLVTAAGSGVAGATASTVVCFYKKYGGNRFYLKSLESVTATPLTNLAVGDTSISFSDTSIFPPENFYITIDLSAGGTGPETVLVSSNNASLNTLSLSTALTKNHVSPNNVVTLRDFLDISNPLVGAAAPANSPNGYYSILFSGDELDTLDQFTFTLDEDASNPPPPFEFFERTIDIISPSDIETEATPFISKCIIKDHIVNLSGDAVVNVSVYARLLSLPTLLSGVGVQDIPKSTSTDANGFFQLTLIQGTTVDITVPSIGFRKTILVPATTLANLFEIV